MPRAFFINLLCIFFIYTSIESTETNNDLPSLKTRLQFLPNVPFHLESHAFIEVTQSLPGLSLSTKGDQLLKAHLFIDRPSSDLLISSAPFDLTFILKELKILILANDEKITFDSNKKEPSLYLNQLSKIIDRSLHLHLGEKYTIEMRGNEFLQLIKEFSVLQEVHPQALLANMLSPLFALSGEELSPGKVIVREYDEPNIMALPNKMEYTIRSIDDYNIYASMKGDIKKTTFSLSSKVLVKDVKEPVQVVLNGNMEGLGKWNRDNAMLSEIEMRYVYTATFTIGKLSWMMNFTIALQNKTTLI